MFGNADGQVKQAITKAHNVHNGKSGPFDILLLLGDVITSKTSQEDLDWLFNKDNKFLLPTIFSTMTEPLAESVQNLIDSDDIDPNLIYLSSGTYTTASGLTIGCVGHNQEEVAIAKFSKQIDILVTGQWPQNVGKFTNAMDSVPELNSIPQSQQLNELVLKSRPRYHFCSAGNVFWERLPFNYADQRDRITRFINLGHFNNSTQKKWFYAFNISTNTDTSIPKEVTKCPLYIRHGNMIFDQTDLRKRPRRDDHHDRKVKRRPEPVRPDTCFFCLSNPNVDKSLIVSIGEESYLALAKGPLTTSTVSDSKPGYSAHILFVPISHVPTYSAIPDHETQSAVALEKQKYLLALRQMYSDANLVGIGFEISRAKTVHIHMQIIPIANTLLKDLESLFFQEAERQGYSMSKRELDSDETEYFKVDIPDAEPLIIELIPDTPFDLQFGRKVIAKLLNCEDRVDWKNCIQSQVEEQADAQMFKNAFKPYEFTV